jgi:hypothetical protein
VGAAVWQSAEEFLGPFARYSEADNPISGKELLPVSIVNKRVSQQEQGWCTHIPVLSLLSEHR